MSLTEDTGCLGFTMSSNSISDSVFCKQGKQINVFGLGDSAAKGTGDNTRVVALPTIGLTTEDGMDEDEEMPEVVASESTPAVISDEDEEMMILALDLSTPSLITLTLLPKTQWKELVNLDIIKVPLVLFIYSMWSLINLRCCLVSLFCSLRGIL